MCECVCVWDVCVCLLDQNAEQTSWGIFGGRQWCFFSFIDLYMYFGCVLVKYMCWPTCTLACLTHIRLSVCTFGAVCTRCHCHRRNCDLLGPRCSEVKPRCNQLSVAHSADRCLVMSNTKRLISCFNWLSFQQGHSHTYVCMCVWVWISALVYVCST